MSRELRFLADLTPPMRKALVRCYATTILVDHDHGIHKTTLVALQRHHLIGQARDKRMRLTWKPTSRGLHIIQTQPPHLLRAGVFAGYTTEPSKAMFAEPEAIDGQVLDDYAKTNQEHHQAFKHDERVTRAQRLEQAEHVAQQRGINVAGGLRQIDRQLSAIERRIA